jgi:hypothetical protein
MELSAPLIPLTLRAMNRPRHPHARGLSLPSAALFSVLALLAFASFPVLAQANPNYETEHTNLPESGEGKPSSHHKNPPGTESSKEAEQSAVPGGSDGGGAGNGGNGASNGGSPNSQVASKGSNPSSPGGGAENQGKSGNGATTGGQPSNGVQIGEPKSSVSDSGGSSPLVPILIAVAVLAAISVGAVLVRQRRGTAGGFSLKRG